MNLVEISEMLKGVPDTFLTKHIKTPDGSVPQYMALAELQRRQDMRARFSQQAPQTTVADDATRGIAAAAPEMSQDQTGIAGYREGGPVGKRERLLEEAKKKMEEGSRVDEIYTGDFFQSPFETLLKLTGFKPTDRQRSVAKSYLESRDKMDAATLKNYGDMATRNKAILAAARARQANAPGIPEPDANQIELSRQYNELLATQAGRGPSAEELAAREAADQRAFEQEQMQDMLDYFERTKPNATGPTTKRRDGVYVGGFDTPEGELSHAEDLRRAQEKARQRAIGGYREGGPVKEKEKDAIDRYLDRISGFEAPQGEKSRPIYRGETLSSATGLYQMLDGTRRRLDKKLGLDPNDRSPATERIRARALTEETIGALEENNFPVTGGSLYGGHLLGEDGVIAFMKAYRGDPNASAQNFFDPKVIRGNPAIFESRRNGELTDKTDLSLAQIMTKLDRVGGASRRTGTSDEDANLGAARQAAMAIDRGEVFPSEPAGKYEDMNLPVALKLAAMLEDSKLRKKPSGKRAEAESPDFFYNPMFSGIASGMGGFSGGGMVKGYSGADGKSSVSLDNEMSDTERALTFGSPEEMLTYERKLAEREAAAKAAQEMADAAKRAFAGGRNFLQNPKDPSGYLPSWLSNSLGLAGVVGDKAAKAPVGPYGMTAPDVYSTMANNFQNLAQQRMDAEKAATDAAAPTTIAGDSLEDITSEFLKDIRESRMSKKEMRDMALLQAGLGMMAGTSPYFAVNAGQGAMSGLQAYQQARQQNQALASEGFRGIMAARAFGLDKRRVEAAEQAGKSEAEYRKAMVDIQKQRAEAIKSSSTAKNSGLSDTTVNKILDIIEAQEIATGKLFTQQEINEAFIRYATPGLIVGGGTSLGPNVSDDAE